LLFVLLASSRAISLGSGLLWGLRPALVVYWPDDLANCASESSSV